MHKTKHILNPVLNKSMPLFGILCFLCIIYLGFIVDYWYLLLLIIWPLLIKWKLPNWRQWTVIAFILLTFTLLMIFANEFSLFEQISIGLKKIGCDIVKQKIFMFLDKYYPRETSSFIKLVLFNVKSSETIIFYEQTVDLGIVWLICISGFHISLLSRIIRKIFKKIPKVGKYVDITILLFYSFLLDFSYASIRVLLKISFEWIFKRCEIQNYNKLGLIGLTICIVNPSCFHDYGFLLSFLVCSISYFVINLQLNNKILSSVLINIFAFIITIPFVIEMNHKISILTFLNAFIFSYFSSISFLYFLVFSWMPFMAAVHHGIIVAHYVVIGNISLSNIFIYSSAWESWAKSLYYICFVPVLKCVYLIVYNNKI